MDIYPLGRQIPSNVARDRSPAGGFTLLELLVVIGIIAAIVAVLLPSLQKARRQAAQTQCSSQLKQVYNAFHLYAGDYADAWPVVSLEFANAVPIYELNKVTYPTARGSPIYYYDFLLKYLRKEDNVTVPPTQVEAEEEVYRQRKNVGMWCPTFADQYYDVDKFRVETDQSVRARTGYGMNAWPTFSTASRTPPILGNPPIGSTYFPSMNFATTDPNYASERASITGYPVPASYKGRFFTATQWTTRQPAKRMLIADSQGPLAQSDLAPAGVTTVDLYRHGVASTKIAYNILFCDGHVDGQTDARAAFESIRQRYPE